MFEQGQHHWKLFITCQQGFSEVQKTHLDIQVLTINTHTYWFFTDFDSYTFNDMYNRNECLLTYQVVELSNCQKKKKTG